jgi:hypothetical protein
MRCERARELVHEVLKELDHGFGKLYSYEGPPSIPPEQLLSTVLRHPFGASAHGAAQLQSSLPLGTFLVEEVLLRPNQFGA